ncbi:polymer-forming cytoskeletal protein [Flavobacterium cupreum]|uniref:polymer-forming cytoskeletal protein n=1 Tax=Flavobacterium cupreum TaxID=2133766 RepID=UPI000FC9DD8B|nr:polymer-forming cytoskeletal protein [Flavobacterium cupreum]
MVKAHSLLYAIYICLIVSIICGALLYFANLYNQLNLYYNLQEELYIQNQSVVNFAVGNKILPQEIEKDENSGIEGNYKTRSYGLLTLLLAESSVGNDTVTSAHFVGSFSTDKTAIYLTNISKPLSYSGTVKLTGDSQLPSAFIETSYITSGANKITNNGKVTVSDLALPEINPEFKKIFAQTQGRRTALKDIERPKDSLYYNSFTNETKEIEVSSRLSNVIFKGNFILRSKDSIRIQKNAVLEDVILIAPKITFEAGFKGTVQAFATKGIELEEKVVLNYPSVICVYNANEAESKIKIKKESIISGAVVLFGNSIEELDKNSMEIAEEGLIFGDIYCTGKLFLRSTVYGSVYTNRFFIQTGATSYDNTIADLEINSDKRPDYFISIPLFTTQKTRYGILKKVL